MEGHTITFEISEAAQKAAVLAGRPAQRKQTVALPEEWLAQALECGAGVNADGVVTWDTTRRGLVLAEAPVDGAAACAACAEIVAEIRAIGGTTMADLLYFRLSDAEFKHAAKSYSGYDGRSLSYSSLPRERAPESGPLAARYDAVVAILKAEAAAEQAAYDARQVEALAKQAADREAKREADRIAEAEAEAEREAREAPVREERKALLAIVLSPEDAARYAAGMLPEREERQILSDWLWANVPIALERVTDSDIIRKNPDRSPICDYSDDGNHDWRIEWRSPADGCSAEEWAIYQAIAQRKDLADEIVLATDRDYQIKVELQEATSRCMEADCPADRVNPLGWLRAVKVEIVSPAGIRRHRYFKLTGGV